MSETTIQPPPAAPEVLAYAEEVGLGPYLPGLLELARKVCPQAPMRVVVEKDRDWPFDRQILIEVDPEDRDGDQLFEESMRWLEGARERCPASLFRYLLFTHCYKG
jgi:hypothetical protein